MFRKVEFFAPRSRPDDNLVVKVVGRAGATDGGDRCGYDGRGRLHAPWAMAQPQRCRPMTESEALGRR